jgi:hypothetical protein
LDDSIDWEKSQLFFDAYSVREEKIENEPVINRLILTSNQKTSTTF